MQTARPADAQPQQRCGIRCRLNGHVGELIAFGEGKESERYTAEVDHPSLEEVQARVMERRASDTGTDQSEATASEDSLIVGARTEKHRTSAPCSIDRILDGRKAIPGVLHRRGTSRTGRREDDHDVRESRGESMQDSS